MYSFVLQSPIGLLFVSVTSRGVRRIDVLSTQHGIEGSPRLAGEHLSATGEHSPAEEAMAHSVETQLRQYFDGDRRDFDLPLDLDAGSAFQRRVWECIARIPYGRVASYGEVAHSAGAPNAYRAAGSACGANPVAIVTPCHRVIAANNRLGGYGLGIENKVWLLRHEGVACAGASYDARVEQKEPERIGV